MTIEATTADVQNPQRTTEMTQEAVNQRIADHMNAQKSAEDSGVDVGVDLSIDVNALINSVVGWVNDAIHGNAERQAFVQTMLQTVTSSISGKHNIMIFNMQQGFTFNPDWSSTWFTSQNYQGIQFGIWVFRGPVQFVNQGDGGWINWGFFGSFNRNGGTLDFNSL
jgi:hypothetical protein